jgi:hypothetical protein
MDLTKLKVTTIDEKDRELKGIYHQVKKVGILMILDRVKNGASSALLRISCKSAINM